MKDFANMPLDALLAPHAHACECGLRHRTQLAYLRIGAGAVQGLPEAMAAAQATRPFIVCDVNTKKAAWGRVKPVLEAAAIPYTLFVFGQEHLEPDEYAVGSLTMAFDPACDVIMAIGSGVINDCAKVLAHATGRKAIVIATAPSMDGYASNSSSMIIGGVKSTVYNACPVAILADTDILRDAPERMLWAGFGDMVAKYVAICEWRIAHLVTGEYYCEAVAGLVRASLRRIVDNAPGLNKRDPQAIEAVLEGLVLSGIAMGYAESSRPASGLDHYFSHLWEMMALERGTPSELHGIQVGVGTLLALRLLSQLKGLTPDRTVAEQAMRDFEPAAWEKRVRRVFGRTAERILDIEKQTGKNDPAKHAKRLDAILAHWDAIQHIMEEELPSLEALQATMAELGMPCTPDDLDIGEQDVQDAYDCSRDIRDKYLTSSLLWDLGLIETIRP